MTDMSTEILSATATARFLGICDACDRPVAETIEDRTGDHATITCPDCGNGCPGQRLYGTTSVDHCNGACEGARGPRCVCGCGGCNHGGAWAKPGHMLADQLAAYRTDKARRRAVVDRRREARQAAAVDTRTLWAAAHEDVVAYLAGDIGWSDFLIDLAGQLDRSGSLSPGQVESVRRNIARQAERDAKRADATAAQPAPSPVVIGEGTVITGTVVKVGTKETQGRTRCVMTVLDDRGFKVYGTVPEALKDVLYDHRVVGPDAHSIYQGPGVRVRFTGDTTTGDRETFGFFNRPRAVEVLTPAAVA